MSSNSQHRRIKVAAAQLFRDKGYAATSMRDLAEAVALKPSSLYNHIASKEALLRDICFEHAHHFERGMAAINPADPPEVQIRQLLRLHIQIATQDVTSVMAFNDEWRHLNEPALSEFRSLRKTYEQRFLSILEAGIRSGAFRDMTPSLALYTLLSSVRWLYDWFRPGRQIEVEKVEAELIDLLMKGLLA